MNQSNNTATIVFTFAAVALLALIACVGLGAVSFLFFGVSSSSTTVAVSGPVPTQPQLQTEPANAPVFGQVKKSMSDEDVRIMLGDPEEKNPGPFEDVTVAYALLFSNEDESKEAWILFDKDGMVLEQVEQLPADMKNER